MPQDDCDASHLLAPYSNTAIRRLSVEPESQFPEIQAWRRAFSKMGLKPTQYRCASESLLRRLRRTGELPRIHPVIDLCHAVSVAYAIPIAMFDIDGIDGGVQVRHAAGDEVFETFSGDIEHPTKEEIIFADESGQAHARRWTNRQSRRSAVGNTTTSALVVAEALHESAREDIERLIEEVSGAFARFAPEPPSSKILTSFNPRFEFPDR